MALSGTERNLSELEDTVETEMYRDHPFGTNFRTAITIRSTRNSGRQVSQRSLGPMISVFAGLPRATGRDRPRPIRRSRKAVLDWCDVVGFGAGGVRSRTPGQPPFSSTNSATAFSSAWRMTWLFTRAARSRPA